LSCAVGLAVLGYLQREHLVDAVRDRGPRLLADLRHALADCDMVKEVRGRGFLLGISYVDPDDGESFLDPELGVARQIDVEARDRQLLLYSTQPTRDGFAGDQTLIAPAFVASDADLDEMVRRVSDTVHAVEERVKKELVKR